MLQVLRNSVAGFFAKILFGLIILSFAVWGMGDIFGGGLFTDSMAEVGDIRISSSELGNEYRREINRLRSMDVSEEQARRMGVLDQVLQRMVNRASFDAEVHDLGIVATDQTVAENIRDNPAFRNEFGQFDRIRLERLLQANGYSLSGYEADLRRDIARNFVLDSLAENTRIPKPIADRIYGWRQEERVAGVIDVPVDESATVPEPGEHELAEYYKANEGEFTAPERRAVSYIHLNAAKFADTISVPDDELRQIFADRASEFEVPETRKVLQMVTTEKAEAETVSQRLANGEAFAEVAESVTGQTAEGIDLGTITRADLPQELSDTVFGLAAGEVSKAVQGPFGWHIFKVEKINPRKEASFAEARDQLAGEVAQERAIERVYDVANRIEDAMGAGANLSEAARELQLELHKLPAVVRSGRDAEGNPIDQLPGSPFLESVFSMPAGETGTLLETQNGGFFIARVDSVTPSRMRPLDEARADVVAAWKHSKRVEMAEARAKTIAAALEAGKKIAEIPEATADTLETTGPLTRENASSQSRLPFAIVNSLFEFEKTGRVALAFAGDRYVLAQLLEVRPAKPLDDAEGYRSVAINLRSSMTSDLLTQYNRALQKEHGVSINRRLIDQAFPPAN